MTVFKSQKSLKSYSINVNGTDLICDSSGALYWAEEKLIVVSDLHLEKSSSFARRGQLLPPYDSERTLNRLYAVIKKYEPSTIVSLGDSFHDNDAYDRLSKVNRALLDGIIGKRQMIWIAGNHDDTLPSLIGNCVKEIKIKSLTFCHEPKKQMVDGEISGHLHPAARIVRRNMSVRRFCFASDGKRMILPAFGAYAGGLELTHKAFENLFNRSNLVACLLGKDCVYPIHIDAFFSG